MIKVYLSAIPSLYEGEDIEVRYSIYQDDKQLERETTHSDYVKPAVTGLISVMMVLNRIERYKKEEIVIYINDPSLYELVRGKSTTKNEPVIRHYQKTKRKLEKFINLTFVNVSKDQEVLAEWNTRTEVSIES